MKHIALCTLIINMLVFNLAAQQQDAAQQLTQTNRTVNYLIRDSIDNSGNLYIRAWSAHPSVFTFVNNDGSVTVCSSSVSSIMTYEEGGISLTMLDTDEPSEMTYVYEYDSNLKEQKTFRFKNELEQLGAFTKDNEGNYYFFYAVKSTNKNTENMAMVKYNRKGEKINTYTLKAQAPSSFDGIRNPFDAGTCRLELAGSMLAVYFAREMFSGHQASYGFVLDKDTFKRIDNGAATNAQKTGGNTQMPYVSHSFNQFILPIDNGFVFVDHGDGYPRSFTFAKFQNGSSTKRQHAFPFPGGTGMNATYAEMGGLAKTSSGYIFTGAYGTGKSLPRNLFILTFDEDLTSCSAPVYLTKYTQKDGHAGHPKIVKVDTDRYLILWEVFKFSTQSANLVGWGPTDYLSTYMLLIDEKGKVVSELHAEPQELKGIRLNINDTLRYNPHNGKVYWAINDSNTSIKIYALLAKDE